jgi:hypothetical protein
VSSALFCSTPAIFVLWIRKISRVDKGNLRLASACFSADIPVDSQCVNGILTKKELPDTTWVAIVNGTATLTCNIERGSL